MSCVDHPLRFEYQRAKSSRSFSPSSPFQTTKPQTKSKDNLKPPKMSSSLSTNITTFLILLPIGIRRMLCSTSLYLNNTHSQSHFRSRIWYFSHSKKNNIDFYTLLLIIPIASLCNLFFFLTSSPSTPPLLKFRFLNQCLVVFFFWVVLMFVYWKDSVGKCEFYDGLGFVFAGVGFLVEWLMVGKGVGGFGGLAYGILGGLGVLCGGCCLYLAVWPNAFFADFLLSVGLVLKGTWVLQAGLSLYTDAFGFQGCGKVAVLPGGGEWDVKCGLEMDKFRGMALMNLMFVLHVVVVIVFSFGVFGVLYRNRSLRYGETSGSQVAEIGSERVQMMPAISEFEIE